MGRTWGKLIRNENMKLYIRPRTWVLGSLLVVSLFFNALLAAKQPDVPPDWKEQLALEIQQDREQVQAEEMHPTAVQKQQLLKQQIALDRYRLDHDIPPSHTTSWLFAKDFVSQLGLSTVLVIVIAGDMVSSEFQWGTIKLLLIRPVTRTKIYVAKYVSVLIFGVLLTGGALLLSVLVGGALFGFSGFLEPYLPNLPFVDMVPVSLSVGGELLITFLCAVLYLWVISTIAFLLSAVSRSSVLSITLTMIVTAVGEMIAKSIPNVSVMKYWLFTNTGLMQYFEGVPPIQGMTLGFSLGVIVVYMLLGHLIGWMFFTNRDVSS